MMEYKIDSPKERNKKQGKLRREYYKENQKICKKCNTKQDLHLHHILPLAVGGGWEMSNIVCLCNMCHKEYHKYFEPEISKNKKNKNIYYESLNKFINDYTIIEKLAYYDVMKNSLINNTEGANSIFSKIIKSLREIEMENSMQDLQMEK